MNDYQTIIRPLITEKNTNWMALNKYSFQVADMATKPQIKHAIQNIFSVTVTRVHTMNVRGKKRRRGREFGYTRGWKKAIVTLAEGDRIEIFET